MYYTERDEMHLLNWSLPWRVPFPLQAPEQQSGGHSATRDHAAGPGRTEGSLALSCKQRGEQGRHWSCASPWAGAAIHRTL